MTRSYVSPSHYIQSDGALDRLAPQVERYGTKALLVTDEVVSSIITDPIDVGFSTQGVEYTIALFGGECTEAEIARLSEIARGHEADVIVGAGGGKAIDVAKGVRGRVGRAGLVSLPTIASTDAPTSGLSVLYTDDGHLVGGRVHDRRPDVVLVDTAIIATAPTRWFVSGIGDAVATRFEAAATAESGGHTIASESPTRAGLALAERCYDVLRTHARDAVTAVREDTITDAVEETTEAIILLSGLGFENGGLAAAHAIHDGIVSSVETDATHGEKVCFGLLTQLALEDGREEIRREVTALAHDVGLPVTLGELGVAPRAVEDIAEAACKASSMDNQPGDPTPAAVAEALREADAFGRAHV